VFEGLTRDKNWKMHLNIWTVFKVLKAGVINVQPLTFREECRKMHICHVFLFCNEIFLLQNTLEQCPEVDRFQVLVKVLG
jgi:hypothetical protein